MKKIAVVLCNLGGPDHPDAVAPFLQNLFSDPAILRVPNFIRPWLARLISARRAPIAREIYDEMGGGSPILPNTIAQAEALATALVDCGEVKCFPLMRYWHPRSAFVVKQITEFAPDEIILLPLYPQFSTTTTASSRLDFHQAYEAVAVDRRVPIRTICCYPLDDGFIAAMAADTRRAYTEASAYGKPRLLLSAHGLPQKVVRDGDPYQWQCEQTAQSLVAALDIPKLDWLNCYQSRVGPLKWIGPATEDEIERAGHDRVPIVLVPIAFVSEHSETLVELDIEYRDLAKEKGVPFYARVPTVSIQLDFINGLTKLVREALTQPAGLCPPHKARLCPSKFSGCPVSGRA
jgi:protoporphyrin/coproporphyrin ferrochelatase